MNPLRSVKYDMRLFHQYNWGVRQAIRAYDEDYVKQYPQKLLKYGYAPGVLCAEFLCDEPVKHRRRYCETHRLERYLATKHRRKAREQQTP